MPVVEGPLISVVHSKWDPREFMRNGRPVKVEGGESFVAYVAERWDRPPARIGITSEEYSELANPANRGQHVLFRCIEVQSRGPEPSLYCKSYQFGQPASAPNGKAAATV